MVGVGAGDSSRLEAERHARVDVVRIALPIRVRRVINEPTGGSVNFIVVFCTLFTKSQNISVISYDIFPNICHTSCLVHTALRNSSQFVL